MTNCEMMTKIIVLVLRYFFRKYDTRHFEHHFPVYVFLQLIRYCIYFVYIYVFVCVCVCVCVLYKIIKRATKEN